MKAGKDRLAVLAHGHETSSLDGDLLYAEWGGALTKQRQHLVACARLNRGDAIIHLTQDLRSEEALQRTFHPDHLLVTLST